MLMTVTYNRILLIRIIRIFVILTLLTSSGCGDMTRPDNPEPLIEISGVSDISRREASVEGIIVRRGSTPLSYADLIYGEKDSGDTMTVSGDPESETFHFALTGLKPGVTYSCHMEAGTATARLKSDTICFTTLPIDAPNLKPIVALSNSPLGIIVGFGITDDGGEPITEAGCEITDIRSNECRRVYVPLTDHDPADLQLAITGLIPETDYRITPFASNLHETTYGEPMEYTTGNSILLDRPGILASILEPGQSLDLESLTISGFMNGDDFRTLRITLGAPDTGQGGLSKVKIKDINLLDVVITEGGGSYDGYRFTVADEVSTGLFSDCTGLRNVTLPNTATTVARDAFANCPSLETITISAATAKVIPSTECRSLKSIEVSAANRYFSSTDGVLFDHATTEILWFPCGKSGDFVLPATVTSIGENTFA